MECYWGFLGFSGVSGVFLGYVGGFLGFLGFSGVFNGFLGVFWGFISGIKGRLLPLCFCFLGGRPCASLRLDAVSHSPVVLHPPQLPPLLPGNFPLLYC